MQNKYFASIFLCLRDNRREITIGIIEKFNYWKKLNKMIQ